jgi:hypothetical protein
MEEKSVISALELQDVRLSHYEQLIGFVRK